MSSPSSPSSLSGLFLPDRLVLPDGPVPPVVPDGCVLPVLPDGLVLPVLPVLSVRTGGGRQGGAHRRGRDTSDNYDGRCLLVALLYALPWDRYSDYSRQNPKYSSNDVYNPETIGIGYD